MTWKLVKAFSSSANLSVTALVYFVGQVYYSIVYYMNGTKIA